MKKKSIVLSMILMSMFCQAKKDLPELKESLLETDREFSKLSIELGAGEAFYRFMDEEGVVLPKRGNPVKGKETYRSLFEKQPDSGWASRLEWEPEWAQISQSGDLGYTFGRYTQTLTDTKGSAEVIRGFYVTIWKRQAGGSWKFVFDTGNEIPPSEK